MFCHLSHSSLFTSFHGERQSPGLWAETRTASTVDTWFLLLLLLLTCCMTFTPISFPLSAAQSTISAGWLISRSLSGPNILRLSGNWNSMFTWVQCNQHLPAAFLFGIKLCTGHCSGYAYIRVCALYLSLSPPPFSLLLSLCLSFWYHSTHRWGESRMRETTLQISPVHSRTYYVLWGK